MEFNRLLSQAISFYGQDNSTKNKKIESKSNNLVDVKNINASQVISIWTS